MTAKEAKDAALTNEVAIKHERLLGAMEKNLPQCRINIAHAVQNGDLRVVCCLGYEHPWPTRDDEGRVYSRKEAYEIAVLKKDGFDVNVTHFKPGYTYNGLQRGHCDRFSYPYWVSWKN